eukprot:129254_1
MTLEMDITIKKCTEQWAIVFHIGEYLQYPYTGVWIQKPTEGFLVCWNTPNVEERIKPKDGSLVTGKKYSMKIEITQNTFVIYLDGIKTYQYSPCESHKLIKTPLYIGDRDSIPANATINNLKIKNYVKLKHSKFNEEEQKSILEDIKTISMPRLYDSYEQLPMRLKNSLHFRFECHKDLEFEFDFPNNWARKFDKNSLTKNQKIVYLTKPLSHLEFWTRKGLKVMPGKYSVCLRIKLDKFNFPGEWKFGTRGGPYCDRELIVNQLENCWRSVTKNCIYYKHKKGEGLLSKYKGNNKWFWVYFGDIEINENNNDDLLIHMLGANLDKCNGLGLDVIDFCKLEYNDTYLFNMMIKHIDNEVFYNTVGYEESLKLVKLIVEYAHHINFFDNHYNEQSNTSKAAANNTNEKTKLLLYASKHEIPDHIIEALEHVNFNFMDNKYLWYNFKSPFTNITAYKKAFHEAFKDKLSRFHEPISKRENAVKQDFINVANEIDLFDEETNNVLCEYLLHKVTNDIQYIKPWDCNHCSFVNRKCMINGLWRYYNQFNECGLCGYLRNEKLNIKYNVHG